MLKNAINFYLNISKWLYKLAVKDYPEWIPEEFKKILEPVEKIEKDPRLINFRVEVPETIKIEGTYLRPFVQEINYELREAVDNFYYYYLNYYGSNTIIKEISKKYRQKMSDVRQLISIYLDLTSPEKREVVSNNKIKIGKQEIKFSKFYTNIETATNSIIEETKKEAGTIITPIKKFDDLSGKKDWDRRLLKKKYEVVFTTKYQDVLGMSSRSEWTSCQNIRPGADWKYDPYYALGVLGSCISKYVGIIYLTDGSDYEGRGERMFFRCTVWLVRNEEGTDVIWLQTMYPYSYEEIRNLFIQTLKEQTGMTVASSYEGLKRYYEKFPEGSHTPYDDTRLGVYMTQDDLIELAMEKPHDYINRLNVNIRRDLLYKMYKKGRIKEDPSLINYADPSWVEYKLYLLEAVVQNPYYLRKLDKNDEDYKTYVLASVAKNKNDILACLPFFNKDWPEYKLYVLNTYHDLKSEDKFRTGRSKYEINDILGSLEHYLDPNWEESKKIVMEEIINSPYKWIKYINVEWDGVDKLLLDLCNKYDLSQYANPEWGDLYKKIVIKCAEVHGSPDAMRILNSFATKDVKIKIIKMHPELIRYADPDWDEFVDLAVAAIKQDIYYYTSMIDRNRSKKHEINSKLIQKINQIPELLSKYYFAENKDEINNVIEAIKGNPDLVKYLNTSFYYDKNLKDYITELLANNIIPESYLSKLSYSYHRTYEEIMAKVREIQSKKL